MNARDERARGFVARRPTGKMTPGDREGLRYLWSLLYRAVRRDAARLENALRSIASLARRIGGINTELTTLKSRVDNLERRVLGERDRRVGER